jgi:hypothetical protein
VAGGVGDAVAEGRADAADGGEDVEDVGDGPDEDPQAVSDSATSPTTAVVQPRDTGDDVIMSSTSASGLSGRFAERVSSLPTTLP